MGEAAELRIGADILPLSPTQTGMLYEILSSRGNRQAYAAFVRVDLKGPLDPTALRDTFANIALAPDVTRVSFVHEGVREPVQVVRAQVDLPFAFDDLSGCDNPGLRLPDLEDAMRRADLPLTQAPLMRLHLVRLSQDRHVLLWLVHHIIMDGWSLHVLLDQVLATLNGRTSSGSGPSFKSHLTRLRARDRKADRAFWADELAGLKDPTLLAGVADEGHLSSEYHKTRLAHTDSAALRELARSARTSVATILSMGWSFCLRRMTRSDDVVFALVTSGRDPRIPNSDQALGPYLNLVPSRLQINPTKSSRAHIEVAHAAALRRAAFDAVALTDSTASFQGTNLPFDTLLSIKNFAPAESRGPLHVTDTLVENPTRFPFCVIVDLEGDIRLTAFYDPHRIPNETARGVLEAYRLLLTQIAAAPDIPVCKLPGPPLPPVESLSNLPHVPAIVAEHASTIPDRVALRHKAVSVTYGELDGRARALAMALCEVGIGKGDIVPVVLQRSAETVIAMLGVLYAGAAYVPIDPTYPAARVAQIFEQVKPKVFVSDGSVVIRDLPEVRVPAKRANWPIAKASVDDPAYVLFTSGSTGRPKGVVVSQGNLAWSNRSRAGVYGSDPGTFLLLSSFAFDSSVVGIYWTLTTGGTLMIAPDRAEQDPVKLIRDARHAGATHLLALPRLWEELLKAPIGCETLDTVIVAGEDVPGHLPKLHRQKYPKARLFNEYGPTESTVWCAAAEIGELYEPIPIGHAPPGAALDVCDLDCNLLPPGIKGEMIVRGRGVTSGYLGDTAATNKAFIPGPERRYRTGDLGTKHADGTLFFLGRLDSQLKIRGHRIELGELESIALSAGSPSAGAASSDDRLVLAVTGAIDAVKSAITERLPPALMPISVHLVPELPRLPNQKIDRNAISQLRDVNVNANVTDKVDGYFERKLAMLWSEILKTDIGPQTNFFESGGDSLKSIGLIAAAELEGIAIRPGDVFRHPILNDLATVLDQRSRSPMQVNEEARISVCHKNGSRRPFFMIHGSQQMNSALAAALGSERPLVFVYSHYLGGTLSPSDSIESFAEDALKTIRTHQPEGPYLLGGYSLGGIIALEAAERLTALREELVGLFLIDPSFYISPPKGVDEAMLVWMKRNARNLLGRFRRLQRRASTGAMYRRIAHRYRPPVWRGKSYLLRSKEAATRGDAILAALPGATVLDMPFEHLVFQEDHEAIATWTAWLAAEVKSVEEST